MDYKRWIEREQNIRLSLLFSSPLIAEACEYRTCDECGEICLCHEETCPNCGNSTIILRRLDDIEQEVLSGKRIRCKKRFLKITQEDDGKEV